MLITFDPRRVISPHFGIILIYCRAGTYKKKISILTRIEKVDFLLNSPYCDVHIFDFPSLDREINFSHILTLHFRVEALSALPNLTL